MTTSSTLARSPGTYGRDHAAIRREGPIDMFRPSLICLCLLFSSAVSVNAADTGPTPPATFKYEPAYPGQSTPCDQQDIWCSYQVHNPNNCEFPNLRDRPENFDIWYGLYNRTWGFDAWRRYAQGWGNPGGGVMNAEPVATWVLYGSWGTGYWGLDPAKEPMLAPFAPGGELEGAITEAVANGATACNGKLGGDDGPVAPPAGDAGGCRSRCCGAQGSVGTGGGGEAGGTAGAAGVDFPR